jgi:hypothetical protein
MDLALAAVVLLAQENPFETLAKPAKRLREADRRAALEYFQSRARDNSVCWACARFLEKTDREWRLSYDRLTTKDGTFLGRVEGDALVTYSGQRIAVSTGKLEKESLDPAAPELDAFFAKHYPDDAFDAARHKAALEAIVAILEKTKTKSEAGEVLRIFGLAHVSALGDRAADGATRLGLVKGGDRWGTGEQITHYLVARNYAAPEKVDLGKETAARSSPVFGARYAAALLMIHKTCAKGTGHESTFQHIAGLSSAGGPKGAADHIKALAAGFKAAVYCKECKNGQVTCGKCKGNKRLDITCSKCEGTGRIKSIGDAGAGATQRCNTCATTGTLKNQPCKDCSQSGIGKCGTCNGKPWRDGNAPVSPHDVFTTERCDSCSGEGWILPNVALACPRCLGLGVKVKPAADPSKTME